MTAATATPARFYAARADGRYRVIDGAVIDAREDGDAPGAAYVATCSSRAKAEAKAAQLNAEEAAVDAKIADEAAAEAAHAEAHEARIDALADAVTAGDVSFDAAVAELLSGTPTAPLAVVTLDGKDTSVEVAPTPAAEAPAEKAKAVRCHGPIHRLLLNDLTVPEEHAAVVGPMLARLAEAKTLTDGGRSISTTAAERAALREVVESWLAMQEAADEGEADLTVRDQRSLAAFLASQWMSA